MTTDFVSASAQRQFWLWCLVAFLAFLTTAQLSYLSVLLRRMGYGGGDLGLILSAWSLPVVPSALLSGHLIRRFGAAKVSALGLGATLLGFCLLEFASSGFGHAVVARLLAGTGFGLMAPAMMVAAKAQLAQRETYFVGVFSAMMMLPQLISPSFAQTYTDAGLPYFFLVTAIPLLLALALALLLTKMSDDYRAPDVTGYLRLLGSAEIRPALVAVLITGGLWGFVSTLLALLLEIRALPIGYYFATFGVTVLITRFFLMRRVDNVPADKAVGCALAMMGLSFTVTAMAWSRVALIAAGAMFALGYSVAFPRSVVWAANRFAEAERAKPIALINAAFNTGGLLSPLLGGLLLRSTSLGTFALCTALLTIGTAAVIIGKRGIFPIRVSS